MCEQKESVVYLTGAIQRNWVCHWVLFPNSTKSLWLILKLLKGWGSFLLWMPVYGMTWKSVKVGSASHICSDCGSSAWPISIMAKICQVRGHWAGTATATGRFLHAGRASRTRRELLMQSYNFGGIVWFLQGNRHLGASEGHPQMPLDALPVPHWKKSINRASAGHLQVLPRRPQMLPRCPAGAPPKKADFSHISQELPGQHPSHASFTMTTTVMIRQFYKMPTHVLVPSTPPDF